MGSMPGSITSSPMSPASLTRPLRSTATPAGHISRKYYYTGVTGQAYTGFEADVDASGKLTRIGYTGVTGAAYSSYEYDYVGGDYAGAKFEFTSPPAGATYSSYETDVGWNSAYAGAKFFFTGIAGQIYTGEEVDLDANSQLSKVVLTGVTEGGVSSIEWDYSAGVYDGYKLFYTAVTGQAYTGLELDLSAASQLEKEIYTGLSGTPYSSFEQDYSGGAPADSVYDYTNVTGQSYNAYQVTENASGVTQQKTIDNNDGTHTIVGFANGQTLTSLGDDTLTGGGANETFVLQPAFGHDTVADFSSHLTGPGADIISLAQTQFANFAAVLGAAHNVGPNVDITASNGDRLTIDNMNTTTLAGLAANFTFHG